MIYRAFKSVSNLIIDESISAVLYSKIRPQLPGATPVLKVNGLAIPASAGLEEFPFVSVGSSVKYSSFRSAHQPGSVGRWHRYQSPNVASMPRPISPDSSRIVFGPEDAIIDDLGKLEATNTIGIVPDADENNLSTSVSLLHELEFPRFKPDLNLPHLDYGEGCFTPVSPALKVLRAMGNVISEIGGAQDINCESWTRPQDVMVLIDRRYLARISGGSPSKGLISLEPKSLSLHPGLTIEFVLLNGNMGKSCMTESAFSPKVQGIVICKDWPMTGVRENPDRSDAVTSDKLYIKSSVFYFKSLSSEDSFNKGINNSLHPSALIRLAKGT